jgi:hypothetical protein
LAKLEDFVGIALTDGALSLAVQVVQLNEAMIEMDNSLTRSVKEMGSRLTSLVEDVTTLTDAVQANSDDLRAKLRRLEDDVAVLKRALNTDAASTSKRMVPEPEAFQGIRNAKELENFLWDMQEYFRAAHIPLGEQVNTACMYLRGDAKLWWRTRVHDDLVMGKPRINEWEVLKKELKSQFLPCNAAWLARQSLKKLEQTGTARKYVKEFSSLMLDISNMSEDDKLFNFMSGLKPWAQVELSRQGVKDLQGAMAAADSLVDYNFSPASSSNSNDPEVGKSVKEGTSRSERWFDAMKKEGNSKQSSNLSYNKDRKVGGCFICEGPHRAKDCPKREKLNALVIAESDHGDDESSVRLGALQILDA